MLHFTTGLSARFLFSVLVMVFLVGSSEGRTSTLLLYTCPAARRGEDRQLSKEEQEQKELIFMYAKKKNREKRMEWIHSDEMPYK